MADRFPGYDVLAKHDSLSWNDQTRKIMDERLALPDRGDVLSAGQHRTLAAIIDRIVPQPEGRPPVNALAMVLDKIAKDGNDGYRVEGMPCTREAWKRGLDAVDAEAQARHGRGFADLDAGAMDALLAAVGAGEVSADVWARIDARNFFKWRLMPDIVSAYYAHPSAWSAMGFGGPASPRGYVRLDANRRDPWEAAEEEDGSIVSARWRNRHAR